MFEFVPLFWIVFWLSLSVFEFVPLRTTSGIRARATLEQFGGVNHFGSSSRTSFGDKCEIFFL